MMTIENIGEMLTLLESAYGKSKVYADAPKEKVLVLWETMFKDDDPAEVAIAVKDCIATLQFPPKIADIKSRIAKQRIAGQMTEMEAWARVVDAINHAYGKEDADKQFFQLPAILQKVVGSPSQLRGWRSVDEAQLQTVVMSAFLKSYRELAQREATFHALPPDIQQQNDWMVAKPVMDALPTPKHERTFEEMEDEDERKTREYREKYLLPELKQYFPKNYANIMEKLRGCG